MIKSALKQCYIMISFKYISLYLHQCNIKLKSITFKLLSAGSRAGGIVAACWAALISYGHQGYIDATKKILNTTKYIAKELEKIDGIHIIGEPEVSVVAFGSEGFNVYGLSEGLKKRGWALNVLQFPSCIHICVTLLHTQTGVAERFVNDVKEVARYY